MSRVIGRYPGTAGSFPAVRTVLLVVIAIVLAACSTGGVDESTSGGVTVTSTTTATSDGTGAGTTEALDVPEQLADHDLDMVIVGDRLMLLAIADSPALRAQGLKQVTDLGDLDGMLFYWRHEASGTFWMEDTVIPLDIVWFDEDGSYVDRASMVPCTEEPCPTYAPVGDPDFRFAIEARPGDLDWIDESTRIVYSD